MFGAVLDGGDEGQGFVGRKAHDLEVGEFRAALGEGSGLVECDHLHVTQRLKRLALAEEHAQLSGTAGADHD